MYSDGFVRVDLDSPAADVRLDLREGLPFAANAIAGIHISHLADQLSRSDVYCFLREARRVLWPGGVLRVDPPCAQGANGAFDGEADLIAMAASAGLALAPERARGEGGGLSDRDSPGPALNFSPAYASWAGRESAASVSVLIPAFNPSFFESSLLSALAQDHPRLEIVVSDDSGGSEIKNIVARHADGRLRYHHNARPYGPAQNYARLLELAQGDYIKYLNDDDWLAPHCVSRMASVLDSRPDVSLVTSCRQRIDEGGHVLPDQVTTHPLNDFDCVVYGQAAFALMRARGNYIGEPTTTMFRKAQMQGLGGDIFDIFGQTMELNVDAVMWMRLLAAGDLAYLVERLSRFRVHDAQFQKRPEAIPGLLAAWDELWVVAARAGMDKPPKSQRHAFQLA